ncbi:CRAL/TRIO domain-containing protein [Rhizodiscina lignyota]|uniref:CRAL/TRIO domain-containing protein n=1 Tax=Rhizodiscina lignyota TaxID=1504668 RepID=A0A9P4MA55_9PEZI|nr:CRAL/TRIO domain-containing protein [Rhizodiscina lignyota]
MPSQIQPGRPGNLTPEQEARLREMWSMTLKLFGVAALYPPKDSLTSSPNGMMKPLSRTSTTGESADTIKKKKRFSVFKKDKDKDKDKKRRGSDASSNDKHGQTKAFKVAMASLSGEDIRKAMWDMTKHDHPDGLLLRFLRARKWDVQAALVMMISTMHWRLSEAKVDSDIMLEGEEGMIKAAKGEESAASPKDGEDFMTQIRMGKSFLRGVDKEGRPMCFVRVRLHRQGEQSEASLERFTVYTIETARMFLKPPVDTATIIFDMTDFSLSNMDYTPVKFMIKCFEANYPESLGAVLVHRAPWLFSSIWSIIRGWLDPVVASKIHFTKSQSDLEQFIPKSNIIKELGGEVDWTYKYVEPVPGENNAMKDSARREKLQDERMEMVKQYEEKTMEWVYAYDKSQNVAKEDQLRIANERNEIAADLRDNYWQLDPYVRARSLYDRTGMLKDFTGAPDMDEDERFTTAPATPMKQSLDAKRSMDVTRVNGAA